MASLCLYFVLSRQFPPHRRDRGRRRRRRRMHSGQVLAEGDSASAAIAVVDILIYIAHIAE